MVPRGHVDCGHDGFDGWLEARLELERDVVNHIGGLAEVFAADVRREAAPAVVMTASEVRTDVVQATRGRLGQQRQQTVVIEHS